MGDRLAELKIPPMPPEVRQEWEARKGEVTLLGDAVLEEVARPVARPSAATRELVDRMKAIMQRWHGMGLAAPQVGAGERVIIYKLPEEKQPLRVIINPKIVASKGEQVGPEGCLSIPLLQGDVRRAFEVTVKGMDMLGRPFKRRATEMEARVIQHEIDHLDGILFIDRAEPGTLHWLTGDERDEEEDDPAMNE